VHFLNNKKIPNIPFDNSELLYKELSKAEYEDVKKILENKQFQTLYKNYIIPTWTINTKELEIDHDNESIFFLVQQSPKMISYPFEWSFNMLKDAALLLLTIVKKSMFNICTGSAYSISYINGEMKFNDILSVTDNISNKPWAGYYQFLQEFLFPLLLTSLSGINFSIWWRGTLRGISLDEIQKLLAKYDQFTDILKRLKLPTENDYKLDISLLNKEDSINTIDQLYHLISTLEPLYSEQQLHWIAYEKNKDYNSSDIKAKEDFIISGLKHLKARRVIDLGSNTGYYSNLLTNDAEHVVATDLEPACIDTIYSSLKASTNKKITPIVCNLLNPSADSGYGFAEYKNIFTRANADFFLALAVMHHITVPTHISLSQFVKSLKLIAGSGIIEWISPEEEMNKRALVKENHRYKNYNWNNFVNLIERDFEIIDTIDLHSGHRTLCLLGPKS
jgi:hypothetical protein